MEDGAQLKIEVEGQVIADRIIYCRSSAARREGLLNLSKLDSGEGILMEMPTARRGRPGLATSIHMIGMKFAICAVWLDQVGQVVHSTIAKPWRLYCASPEPAWYVLEVHPELERWMQNDAKLYWEEVS